MSSLSPPSSTLVSICTFPELCQYLCTYAYTFVNIFVRMPPTAQHTHDVAALLQFCCSVAALLRLRNTHTTYILRWPFLQIDTIHPGDRCLRESLYYLQGGPTYHSKETLKNQKESPEDQKDQRYESVFAEEGKSNGGGQEHNEYVTYDVSQVYPEYLVYIRL
jgi:hypothetical protein